MGPTVRSGSRMPGPDPRDRRSRRSGGRLPADPSDAVASPCPAVAAQVPHVADYHSSLGRNDDGKAIPRCQRQLWCQRCIARDANDHEQPGAGRRPAWPGLFSSLGSARWRCRYGTLTGRLPSTVTCSGCVWGTGRAGSRSCTARATLPRRSSCSRSASVRFTRPLGLAFQCAGSHGPLKAGHRLCAGREMLPVIDPH